MNTNNIIFKKKPLHKTGMQNPRSKPWEQDNPIEKKLKITTKLF